MSGQIPGRVPNQAGPSLTGLSQQNGNSVSTQLQGVGGHRTTLNMDPEFVIRRQHIQKMIYNLLLQRQHQPQTIPPKRVMDIVRRLDEGLFKSAATKEEYLNLETLEIRLHVLIKRIPLNNHNQQLPQHANSSSTIGTMIPTPGIPQSGNSSLMATSSVDNSMIPSSGYSSVASSTINTGSFLPTATGAIHSGSFNSSNGPFTDGCQQSPSIFSISSGANSMMSSTGVQRMTSQMIPTPGFNNNINNNSSQSYMNLESSSNGVGFSSVESMVSQPLQQKQHAHMSGQILGRVPNQAGPSLTGLSQQNGNSISTELQGVGGHRTPLSMDPEFAIRRQNIQKMIYKFLLQRQHQPQTIPPKKVMDIVRRLEEGLFKSAATKEEYLNLETLEIRLHVLIRIALNNHNQQLPQHVNSSSTIGTMIPTPGIPQSGNSSLMATSSVDNSMIPSSGYSSIASSTINTGSFLPTATGAMHSGSFNSSNGPFTDGYQQSPSNFSISSGANSLMSSMGVPRMTSQLIPTPGFNNNNNNSQSYMNLESSSNGVGFSSVESMVSQPLQQNQHAHMSGQIPGRVPNQAGPSLTGLSQQNGNSISTQLQGVGGHRTPLNMDPEFAIRRQNIQKMIYRFLVQRQHQPQTIPHKKVMDIVRRLEEGLFKSAATKEEYLNLETLENRLHVLIKRIPLNNHNQQLPQHVNSSSTIGTMIPTPGMPQSGNSSLMATSSVDNSMIPSSGYNNIASSTINTGSFLPTATGGSLNSSNGPFSDGYQQSPSNFSISSGANSMMSSTGVQRMTSQMIHTPGFNNNNSQSYMNLESSSNGVGFSSVESMVSQPLQQKRHVGSRNSNKNEVRDRWYSATCTCCGWNIILSVIVVILIGMILVSFSIA